MYHEFPLAKLSTYSAMSENYDEMYKTIKTKANIRLALTYKQVPPPREVITCLADCLPFTNIYKDMRSRIELNVLY